MIEIAMRLVMATNGAITYGDVMTMTLERFSAVCMALSPKPESVEDQIKRIQNDPGIRKR